MTETRECHAVIRPDRTTLGAGAAGTLVWTPATRRLIDYVNRFGGDLGWHDWPGGIDLDEHVAARLDEAAAREEAATLAEGAAVARGGGVSL